MNRLGWLLSLGLVAASTGCIITTSDDTSSGASSSNGGSSSTGGTSSNGGSSAGGAALGGGGSSANGGSGTGGGAQCQTPDDCPAPTVECVDPTCPEGVCQETPSDPGTICTAGVCDGAGSCVECLVDADCDTAAGETCDGATNTCVGGTLGGVCGPNLCELLPMDNACFSCVQMKCNPEVVACSSDGANHQGQACIDCLEWANGGGDPTCAGSIAIAQNIIDCACTIGNCAQ